MADQGMADRTPTAQERLSQAVGTQEQRKLKARRAHPPIWAGFGMFGLIGWSVAAPTLLGLLAGVWLDAHHHGAFSWTLALLLAGLFVGCLTAAHWLQHEHDAIRREEERNGG